MCNICIETTTKPKLWKTIFLSAKVRAGHLQGCPLRKIEGSSVFWTCGIKGAQHRISRKKLRFSSCLKAKARHQGILGVARVQPCLHWIEYQDYGTSKGTFKGLRLLSSFLSASIISYQESPSYCLVILRGFLFFRPLHGKSKLLRKLTTCWRASLALEILI